MSKAGTTRLFVALWPDAATRAAISAVAEAHLHGLGQTVPAANLHLTLAFLGSVEPQTRRRLETGLDKFRSPVFTLVLERLGRYPRAQVAWSAPAEVPGAALDLAAAVNTAVAAAGLVPEDRAFSPHVTLARKVRAKPPVDRHAPIAWAVDTLALVRSETLPGGARYRALRTWLLAGN